MTTAVRTVTTVNTNASLFEGITLLHALADLADPVLRKHDKPDRNDNATSRHSRFVQLAAMLEAKMIAAARELDRQSLQRASA